MTDIFKYILNLDKGEKISFKHFCRQKSKDVTNYEQLFNIIEVNKIDTDKDLEAYLHSQNLHFNNLSNLKNILFKKINEAISQLPATAHSIHSALEDLQQIEHFYNQGLYRNMLPLIKKAYHQFIACEQFKYVLILMDWSRKLNNVSDLAVVIESDEQKILTILNQLNELNNDYEEKIAWRSEVAKPRNKDFAQKIKKWESHYFQIDEKNLLSHSARKRYYEILALIEYFKNNTQSELHNIEKAIAAALQIAQFENNHPLEYIHLQSRRLILSKTLNMEQYPVIRQEMIDFGNRIITINKLAGIKTVRLTLHTEIIRLINERKYIEAEEKINESKEFLTKYHDFIKDKERISFLYLNVYIKIALGKYVDGLKYVQEIICDFKKNVRPDLYGFSQILFLLIHFEIGNKNLLSYLGRSAYYYLHKNKRLFQVEKEIIALFKKSNKMTKPAESILYLRNFEHKLIELLKDDYERRILHYFDFELWIKARLQDKTMAEYALIENS